MHRKCLALASALLIFTTCPAMSSDGTAPTTNFVYSHDHVLGTSLEIQVQADSDKAADAAETRILNEIHSLEKIFSTYDPDSEFSRWQNGIGTPTSVSTELFEVLTAAEAWSERSQGAFQPGIEVLSQIWRKAQQANQVPQTSDLEVAMKLAHQKHWRLDATAGTATRLSKCPLTLNAIAKGAIVEWACRAGSQDPEIRGLIVNLGGDLRVYGDAVREISIANPVNDAVNAVAMTRIFVTNRAVATSGNYRRGFQIDGKHYSHIIDPRTGQPSDKVLSATVVAPSSTDADALATICNVLPIKDSLRLVRSYGKAECLIVTESGEQHRSDGWEELTSPRLFRYASSPSQLLALVQPDEPETKSTPKATEKATPELHDLIVKFELDRPSGAQYRRPFVAVWLEDADEFPVRTAVLWMQTRSPGPRWHRDLLRWYRNDGVRKVADGTQLIGTVSAATRGPGEYKAHFDGLDDAGKPLKPGKYTLYIEVAREHGTYQIIRHPLTLGKDPIAEAKLKGNLEVKSASVEYRPREAKPSEKDAK